MEAEPRLFLATLSRTVATVSLRLFSPCGFPEPGVQGSGALCLCPMATWVHTPYGVALPCGGISIHSFPSEKLATLLRLLLPEEAGSG